MGLDHFHIKFAKGVLAASERASFGVGWPPAEVDAKIKPGDMRGAQGASSRYAVMQRTQGCYAFTKA